MEIVLCHEVQSVRSLLEMFKVASESLKRNGRSLCAHIFDALVVAFRLVLWLPSVPAQLSMLCWLLRKNEVQSSMVVETKLRFLARMERSYSCMLCTIA